MSFFEAHNQKNHKVSLSVLLSYGTGLTIGIIRITVSLDEPPLQSLNYAIKTRPMVCQGYLKKHDITAAFPNPRSLIQSDLDSITFKVLVPVHRSLIVSTVY